MNEEPFGPVAIVNRFATCDEATGLRDFLEVKGIVGYGG